MKKFNKKNRNHSTYSVEVDQSGKIGDTRVNTVLAFSNSNKYSIEVTSQVKRKCLETLRQNGKSGTTLYLELFSSCLFLLLKDHIDNVGTVKIDIEYQGHNAKIKEHLINLFLGVGKKIDKDKIEFILIGKKSNAHLLAIGVYRGKIKPDKKISFEDIIITFRTTPKKTGDSLRRKS
ncbi:MAG: hypothetical protein G01um101416_28 [Microgenomates group bacterium Gr01-1014_16]|nr:MAG: hypothetical protein G01um101416_28 [Microgenomates group bacterium Gr01-1014_16]